MECIKQMLLVPPCLTQEGTVFQSSQGKQYWSFWDDTSIGIGISQAVSGFGTHVSPGASINFAYFVFNFFSH